MAAKIRAIVFQQSRIVEDRTLLQQGRQEDPGFGQLEICKPGHYAGYLLRLTTMEFYQRSRHTINDRVKFTLVS